MKQSPRVLWNTKVHYHVHKNTPLDPNLSLMSTIHILTLCVFKIRSNIIIPTQPKPPNGTFRLISCAFLISLTSHLQKLRITVARPVNRVHGLNVSVQHLEIWMGRLREY
jgi:hypothetical protein